jgi:hypothetical protein
VVIETGFVNRVVLVIYSHMWRIINDIMILKFPVSFKWIYGNRAEVGASIAKNTFSVIDKIFYLEKHFTNSVTSSGKT